MGNHDLGWVVLGTTSSGRAQVFGTFRLQVRAEGWARRMERMFPNISWLAIPLTPKSVADRHYDFKKFTKEAAASTDAR